MALVAWRIVCRSKSLGGLGIRHLRHTNTALLANWVSRIMQQSEDLAVVVLRGCYGASIDWDLWSTPRRGDLVFMQGLRPVFTCMQSLFQPRVGNGASFSFWEVDWSGHGRFQVCYRQLHALALGPRYGRFGTLTGSPSFPALCRNSAMQTSLHYTQLLSHASCQRGTLMRGVWRGGHFSVRVVYRHFQGLESTSDSPTILKCCHLLWKFRIPLKIKLFGWLFLRQQSLRQRFYPDALVECPLCAGAADDCSHLFFECRFVQMAWRATTMCCLVTSSADSFWQSISRGPFRRASE